MVRRHMVRNDKWSEKRHMVKITTNGQKYDKWSEFASFPNKNWFSLSIHLCFAHFVQVHNSPIINPSMIPG